MSQPLDLENWQTQFANNIQNSTQNETHNNNSNNDFEFTNNPRFSIYKNNVFHSLIEALKAQFPVCMQLVGEDFFKATAKAYLSRNLPNHADMILIGKCFSVFLENFEHTKSIPVLSEIAKLEYTRAQSLHSEEKTCIDHSDLNLMDINVLQQQSLVFHPSVFLLDSNFSIFSIWKAHQPGNSINNNVINSPQATLIFRDSQRVACTQIDDATFQCLSHWKESKSLIEGIQLTIEAFPEFNPTDVIEFTFSNPLITAVK